MLCCTDPSFNHLTGPPHLSQVIKAVLKDADDKTELALLYANQTPDDILLFDELQALAADPRLRIHYTGMQSGNVLMACHPLTEPEVVVGVALGACGENKEVRT